MHEINIFVARSAMAFLRAHGLWCVRISFSPAIVELLGLVLTRYRIGAGAGRLPAFFCCAVRAAARAPRPRWWPVVVGEGG